MEGDDSEESFPEFPHECRRTVGEFVEVRVSQESMGFQDKEGDCPDAMRLSLTVAESRYSRPGGEGKKGADLRSVTD